jgi:hypothetical protein
MMFRYCRLLVPMIIPFIGGTMPHFLFNANRRTLMMRLASLKRTAYIPGTMLPVINMEEMIGKTVGRRKVPARSGFYGLGLQTSLGRLFRSRVPRGVFRFHSHQEADQWLMNHLTRKPES